MTRQERQTKIRKYMGKEIDVIIDRPIGSRHPKHRDIIYPINYGYIPNTNGGDGMEQDVYVLGVNRPISKFHGRVIGIIHRENDNEDKLVAAPAGMLFNQAEIAAAVYFQERYFKSTIDSFKRKSCGIIVYRKAEDKIQYLVLLQACSKTWSVPKGHMEAFESEEECAKRELFEETGLSAKMIPGFRQTVHYKLNKGFEFSKEVVLFLANIDSEPTVENDEISKHKWVCADGAKELLHKSFRQAIDKAEEFLKCKK